MYFLVIFLMVFFTWRYEFSKKKVKNTDKSYWLLYFIFVFMSGFRYRLGVDSVMYEDAYSYYPPLSQYVLGVEYVRDAKDVFWAILNSTCRSFTDSFVLVQVVLAIFVNGVFFWFVRKHSLRPFFSILIYFFTLWPLLTFEALRESVSVAFFILALDTIICGRKDYLLYYLRVWPACFFHTFGFMTLFFPIISFIRPGKLTAFITFILSVLVVSASYIFSDILSSVAVLSSAIEDKAIYYLESDLYGTNVWSIGGILAIIIGYVMPIVLFIRVLCKYEKPIENWFFPYLVFMLIIALFKINMPLVYRFFNYFYIVLIIAMTESLSIPRITKKDKMMVVIGIVCFSLMILNDYRVVKTDCRYPNIYRYYPYNSIFTKDINPETESLLPL